MSDSHSPLTPSPSPDQASLGARGRGEISESRRRALITGIPGFVGGYLAEHLLQHGDAVLGCSPDGAWLPFSPPSLRDRVEVVAWEIGRPDGLDPESRARIERFAPDCIYHLAALSVPDDCGPHEPTVAARAINIDGTRRVMELADWLPSRPRVLFTSSSHVYAPVTQESFRVDETAPVAPHTGYAWSKRLGEEEVRRAVRESGCDGVIVRAFQHTGPGQSPRMMLPHWARQFACGGTAPVEIYTRDARIDLTDVRDVVRAYRLLMRQGRSGEVYNVGSGVVRTSGEVLELLRARADPERPIIETRPGLRQDPVADNTRLVACTGWRPEVPLEATVADTLAWWRRQCA